MLRAEILSVATAIAILASHARACYDPGQNVCASGTHDCTPLQGSYTFKNGDHIGAASSLSLSDLTKGCYCQAAAATWYSGEEPMTFYKPTTNTTLVTSCSPTYDAWWDGSQVMNTTGGTLGNRTSDDDYLSIQYETMACARTLSSTTVAAPSGKSQLYLIAWPSVPQGALEVSLPSNVQPFDDGDCPGYDSGIDHYPNQVRTSSPAASTLTNCTCYTDVVQALGTSGSASDYKGNTVATVCDAKQTVYYNGMGWRSVRNYVESGPHRVTDYCLQRWSSATNDYDTGLVYVVPATNTRGATGNSSATGSNGLTGMSNGRQNNDASAMSQLGRTDTSALVILCVALIGLLSS